MDYSKANAAYYEEEWGTTERSDREGDIGYLTTRPPKHIFAFLKWLKEKKPDGRALDLGCGAGRTTRVFAEAGYETYGIDFIAKAIEFAEKETKGLGIRYTIGSVLDTPYADSYFDILNDDGCLHHIEPKNWSRYGHELGRIMKPGAIYKVKAFSKHCDYFRDKVQTDIPGWLHNREHFSYFFDRDELVRVFDDFSLLSINEVVHSVAKDKKFYIAIFQKS